MKIWWKRAQTKKASTICGVHIWVRWNLKIIIRTDAIDMCVCVIFNQSTPREAVIPRKARKWISLWRLCLFGCEEKKWIIIRLEKRGGSYFTWFQRMKRRLNKREPVFPFGRLSDCKQFGMGPLYMAKKHKRKKRVGLVLVWIIKKRRGGEVCDEVGHLVCPVMMWGNRIGYRSTGFCQMI